MDNQIYIRPVIITDAPNILIWENNAENWSVSDNKGPYSIFDIVQLINDLKDIHSACQGRWIICRKTDNIILGAVDLTEIDFDKKEASVGVLIAEKEHRKRGYALASLDELSGEAVKLGLDRLMATVQSDNIASQKLFQKCGYKTIAKSDDRNLSEGAYIETLLFEKWLKK